MALTRLGGRVADLYSFPQDIEWAWTGERLFLLQSRPITSLFPLPQRLPAEPLKVLFSFAAIQGIFDPLTPIGIDTIKTLFAGGAGLFGVRVTAETQGVLYTAAGRLWVDCTPIISNSAGRRVAVAVLGLVEPTIRQAVQQILADPRLQPRRPGIRLHSLALIARFLLPVAANIALNLTAPRWRREKIIQNGEQILKEMEARGAAIEGDRWEKLVQGADLLPDFATRQFAHTFTLFVSGVAAGMASWNLLNQLVARAQKTQKSETQAEARDLVLQMTRGMPYNPTIEMDLALWEVARGLQRDPASRQLFQDFSPSELATQYLSGELPEKSRPAVDKFLTQYGGRGLGEIDLGRPRWAEDPTHVFEMLASFLQIEDDAHAPDAVFARGAASARQAVDQLAGMIRKKPGGWIKARLVWFLAGRARQWMGARESPKFFAVRMFWLIRRMLLETGWELSSPGS